jgi:hypothetical protein
MTVSPPPTWRAYRRGLGRLHRRREIACGCRFSASPRQRLSTMTAVVTPACYREHDPRFRLTRFPANFHAISQQQWALDAAGRSYVPMRRTWPPLPEPPRRPDPPPLWLQSPPPRPPVRFDRPHDPRTDIGPPNTDRVSSHYVTDPPQTLMPSQPLTQTRPRTATAVTSTRAAERVRDRERRRFGAAVALVGGWVFVGVALAVFEALSGVDQYWEHPAGVVVGVLAGTVLVVLAVIAGRIALWAQRAVRETLGRVRRQGGGGWLWAGAIFTGWYGALILGAWVAIWAYGDTAQGKTAIGLLAAVMALVAIGVGGAWRHLAWRRPSRAEQRVPCEEP